MKNDQPGHIIHSYFKSLYNDAEKMKKGFSEEAIHLFRVDVKKLRAYMRMIRPTAGEPEQLKFPRKFKKMYSLAGKIRDRQLCLKRIKKHDRTIDEKCRNKIYRLEKEIEMLKENKEHLLTKQEFIEIEEKIIRHAPGILEETLIKHFFLQHLDAINQIVSRGDYEDPELHSIRKSIKDIIYITRIFRDDLKIPLPFSFWNTDELIKAENLSHKLGLFNDVCIALSFLLPTDIKTMGTVEKKHLLSVRRKWLEEKRSLKKEILANIPAIRLDMPRPIGLPRIKH